MIRHPGASLVASALALALVLPACGVEAVPIQSKASVEIGPAEMPSAITYYAGTGKLTMTDGRTGNVDFLMVRTRAADAKTTEERWYQVGEPLIHCTESIRTLLRDGARLTVTEVRTGLTGEGVQEGEARYSWHGTLRNGNHVASTVEVTRSGQLDIVTRGSYADGNPMTETYVTYVPVTREEYDRRRVTFEQRCASTPQP